MTTVHGNIRDITGRPHYNYVTFAAPTVRAGDDAVITRQVRTVLPDTTGAIAVELEPGPALVMLGDDVVSVTVPDDGGVIDLEDLLDLGETPTVPPGQLDALVAAAIEAYMAANPIEAPAVDVAGAVTDYFVDNPIDTPDVAAAVAAYFVDHPIEDPDVAGAVAAYMADNPIEVPTSTPARWRRPFPTLAAIGDSITAVNSPLGGPYRAWRESWVDMGVMLGGLFDFIGASAFGGISIETAAADHTQPVVDAAPDFCLVTLGHNNYVDGVDAAERAALVGIWERLAAVGTTPIVVTNLPAAADPILDDFNAWLRLQAAQRGYPMFDAWSAMVDPVTARYRPGEGQSDGVHPSAQGAARLAKAFAAWTSAAFTGYTGAAGRLVRSVIDQRPNGEAGLLLNGSDGLPEGWTSITAGTPALAPGMYGQIFTGTKTDPDVRYQVNTAPIDLDPDTWYRLVLRVSAAVEAFTGSWAIEVYDTPGYTVAGVIEHYTLDVDDVVVSMRVKTSAESTGIHPVLKVMGGPDAFHEGGGVGSWVELSQITVDPV